MTLCSVRSITPHPSLAQAMSEFAQHPKPVGPRYTVTTLSLAVCPASLPEGYSPIYAGSSTIVSVCDEGGGPFIELQDVKDGSTVKLDPEELDAVMAAAKHLLAQESLQGRTWPLPATPER